MFVLNIPSGKTGLNLFKCFVAPENFPLDRLNSHVPFTFQPDFPETFVLVNNQ